MESIEAVVLTGGASRRMGADKSAIPVGGMPMGERVVRELAKACVRVTILGPSAIGGATSLPDERPGEGPLAALAGFEPAADFVFVASCDLPRFDASVVAALLNEIADSDGAVPVVGGRLQPLCALYRGSAWRELQSARGEGSDKVMEWIARLRIAEVSDVKLSALGLDPRIVLGVNTSEQLDALLDG